MPEDPLTPDDVIGPFLWREVLKTWNLVLMEHKAMIGICSCIVPESLNQVQTVLAILKVITDLLFSYFASGTK